MVVSSPAVPSPAVPAPAKVAYACWQNPAGCNLYNKEGLPASPFYMDDVNAKFTITATAGAGGTVSPAGATRFLKRQTALYTVTPDAGFHVREVKVDGKSVGAPEFFTFDPLYAHHTIEATFVFPINAQAGYGGSITPNGTTAVAYGGRPTYQIVPCDGFSIAKVTVDGLNIGPVASHTFDRVTASHAITATFAGTGGGGGVPRTDKLLCSFLTDNLPASGKITAWASFLPAGKNLTPLGSPEVAVAKPARLGSDPGWTSLVDLFYDRLVLGIMNGSGKVVVRRNGSLETSGAAIPDGQTTILSLVVQPDGAYQVHANGTRVMDVTTTSGLSALVPGVAGGFANHITPDAGMAFRSRSRLEARIPKQPGWLFSIVQTGSKPPPPPALPLPCGCGRGRGSCRGSAPHPRSRGRRRP